MKKIKLNHGTDMPLVGFGTWNIRGQAGEKILLEALDVGYRLIDTAKMYSNENIVGSAFKKSGLDRNEVFITTKLDGSCNSYQASKKGIEESLEQLKMDYVDLLLVHESYSNALDMYKACIEALADGKAKAIGVSNFKSSSYSRLISQFNIIPDVNQMEAHVYYIDNKLKDEMALKGTYMQAWAPFTQGKRKIFEDPILMKIGKKHKKTAGQIALKFLIQNEIAVIPKTVHRERMVENIELFDFELSIDELNAIELLNVGHQLFSWY